jgi:hypothetical protein
MWVKFMKGVSINYVCDAFWEGSILAQENGGKFHYDLK